MGKRSLLRKQTTNKVKNYDGMLAKLIKRGVKVPQVVQHDKGVRVSRMHDLCIRERIFAYHGKVDVAVDSMDFTGLYFTQVGTKVHSVFQDIVFSLIPVLKGNWKCHTCDSEWEDCYAPECCQFCFDNEQRQYITYEEYEVVDDTNKRKFVPDLIGHVDGVLCLNRLEAMAGGEMDRTVLDKIEEDLILFEMKTAGFQMMKKVMTNLRPPEYYCTQATCYQKMSGYDRTMFLYLGRDSCNLNSFIYKGEDRLWKMVNEKMDQLELGRSKGILPQHKECSSATCKRAKGCPFRDMCYGFEPLPSGLSEETNAVNLKKVKI